MYEYKIQIGICHVGKDSLLKPGQAVDLLQNATWFQLNTMTDFMDYFTKNNSGMYLVSRQMEFFRRPAYGEWVTVKSWVTACDTRFGYRNTAIYDESGKLCIGAYAVGVFVDLEKAAPAKMKAELVEGITFYPALDMEILPRKVAIPEDLETGDPFRVQDYHLDYYGHMNNARSVDIAAACLPEGFQVRRLRAEYRKAALAGDTLCPCFRRLDEKTVTVVLRDRDGVVFTAMEFCATM